MANRVLPHDGDQEQDAGNRERHRGDPVKYLGKKVVVTGGTHGMGRAVVDKLIGNV